MCLKAFQQHKTIVDSHSAVLSLRTSHLLLLRCLRAKCLQEVSSLAYRKFDSSNVQEGIQIALALVVPAMNQTSESMAILEGNEQEKEVVEAEEVGAIEKVREEWCQCLNRPHLSEGRSQYFLFVQK